MSLILIISYANNIINFANGPGVAGLQSAFQLLEIREDLKKAKDPVAQLEKVDGDVIYHLENQLRCSAQN